MSRIVVNDEQAALITASSGTLKVRDSQGQVIGYLTPRPSDDEIAAAKVRLEAGPQGPILVNDEQAASISSSNETLKVLDGQGRLIGYLTPCPTAGELAELKARLAIKQPTYSTAEVLDYLRSLEQQ